MGDQPKRSGPAGRRHVSAIDDATNGTETVAAEDGDFSLFYNAQYRRLMGSLVLYTGDRELAMDLAQEAMARAYRDWRKVAYLASPSAWLHRVAFNLANSAFRRRLVEWRSSARTDAWEATTHRDADTGVAVSVRAAVAALPKRQKTALVLRYYADMPVAEAAEAMGCAEGTVRALTSQALDALRRSGLAADLEDEG